MFVGRHLGILQASQLGHNAFWDSGGQRQVGTVRRNQVGFDGWVFLF